jgi:hypothetical protein
MIKNTYKKINWSDFIALATIISCGFIFTHHFSLITDIGLYDESNYLLWGFNFSKTIPPAENGSGYAFWYYLLSLVEPDRVKAYYVNAKLLTLLLPFCIFITLRTLKAPIIPAFLVSILFLISTANFPMSPKVSQFGIIIMLIGLSISLYLKETHLKICILILTALLVSYTRPEFYLSWIIFSCLGTLYLIRSLYLKTYSTSSIFIIVATLLLSFLIIFILGRPMGDGTRSIFAFGQHYAANWVVWNGSSLNPWTNWNTFFNADFKGSTSVLSAAITNPPAFLRHVISNALLVPTHLNRMVTLIYSEQLFKLIPTQFKILMISSIVYFGIVLVNLKNTNLSIKPLIDSSQKFSFKYIVFLLILLLPSSISVLLIGPREHYLLFLEILSILIIFIAIIIPASNFIYSKNSISHNQKSIVPLVLICVVALFLIRPMADFVKPQAIDNLNTIEFIKSLNIKKKTNMLEAEGGYDIYLSENFSRVPEYAKGEPFDVFKEKNAINAIVVSTALKNDSRFLTDSTWNAFISNPEASGFIVLDVPKVKDRKIILNKELLN